MHILRMYILTLCAAVIAAPHAQAMITHNTTHDQVISMDDQLLNAAENGDISQLQELINNGANVNTYDVLLETTPLHKAAENSFYEIASRLIQYGAHINAQDTIGNTPLHEACWNGYINIAGLLVSKGAIINAPNNNNDTPLHKAAVRKYERPMLFLIQCGANYNAINNNGETPYGIARSNGLKVTAHLNTLNSLKCAADYEPNERKKSVRDIVTQYNSKGRLFYAGSMIGCNHVDIARDILASDDHACSILPDATVKIVNHMQLHRNNIDNSKYQALLDYLLLRATKSATREMTSSYKRQLIRGLIKIGADVNARDNHQQTPLHIATETKSIEVVKTLLDNGAHINALDGNGPNAAPLHTAASDRHQTLLQLLIDHGADVNIRRDNGETPLHIATREGYEEICKILIQNGADINIQDCLYSAALHENVENAQELTIVKLLIQNGANVNVRDDDGATERVPHRRPLDIVIEHEENPYEETANKQEYREIANTLIQNGAQVTYHDLQENSDITMLLNRISSLKNGYIDRVITKDSPRENRIYYTQAMIAYGYCNIAQQIIKKLSPLSDDEYADIMVHAIQHLVHTKHYHNNQNACDQFITDVNAFIAHMRKTYEDEHNNKHKAQTAANKVWNNVRNGYASPQVIAWVLDNYEAQCSDFRDDNDNTILHIATTDKRLNPYLPRIATCATQNQDNHECNDNDETPEMIAHEHGNHPGQSTIYNIACLQGELSKKMHLSKPLPTTEKNFTSELGKRTRPSYAKQQYELPPEIRNHIITYIPNETFPDYFHNEVAHATDNTNNN